MKFRTELNWKSSGVKLNLQSNLLFIGSCFAENIGKKFQSLKFKTTLNSNGIIFHPIPIYEILNRALQDQPYTANDLVFRNNMYFSWLHNSQHFHKNESSLLKSLNEQQSNLQLQLKTASHLFLTFGTAWGYKLTNEERIVANCHKIDSSNFKKNFSTSNEIAQIGIETLHLLQKENPSLQVLFSVSPVRHIKDGIIENNRSKAELISATYQIIEATKNTHYIPGYEWLIDDLRDYRFYTKDLIHPSEAAIEYIWEKISNTFFESETLSEVQNIKEIVSAINHKPFQPDSKGHQQFLKKTIFNIEALENSIKERFTKELITLNAQLI